MYCTCRATLTRDGAGVGGARHPSASPHRHDAPVCISLKIQFYLSLTQRKIGFLIQQAHLGKQKALASIGLSEAGVVDLEERGLEIKSEMVQRANDINRQKGREKMRESKFNPLYKKLIPKGEGAEYLRNINLNVKEKRAIGRFRTGGAGRAAEYWRSKEEKVCRMCGEAEETVSHMVLECFKGVKWKGRVEKLLEEEGGG